MSKSKGERFVQEFVVPIGFLNGLWIYIGVNPEDAIASAIISVLNTVSSGHALLAGIGLALVSLIALIVSLIAAFEIGSYFGLAAIGLAFIGGIFISSFGVWFLFMGIILGLAAPDLADMVG